MTPAVIREQRNEAIPFFSICVPQCGRFLHLKKQIERLAEQDFKDFEVCISDDRSPENGWAEVCQQLEKLGLRFGYSVQAINQRYDGNLRTAIDLARGEYILLMGNDDRLAGTGILRQLHERII